MADTNNTASQPSLPKLLGEYEIIEVVRNSPTGAICRAKHQLMGRLVLIKMMPAEARTHDDLRKRFEREVRLAAQLSHPNLVNAHHADRHGDMLYLVLQDVQGIELDKLVKENGPLDPDVAVDYVCQAARGLGYLHEQGIFHRNVKPAKSGPPAEQVA